MPHNVQGPLSKWTNVIQGWQFRWFILDYNSAMLSYFTSKENMSKGERRGCIRLKDAFVGYDNEDDITFSINTAEQKTFHLQANNLEERKRWVAAIENTIRHHKSNKSARNSYSLNQSHLIDDLSSILNQNNFKLLDKSLNLNSKNEQFLNESEQYVEILNKYLKILNERNEDFNERKSNQNGSDQEKSNNDDKSINSKNSTEHFFEASQVLIQTLKHSIDWLQIIKSNKNLSDCNYAEKDYQDFLQIIQDLKKKIDNIREQGNSDTKLEQRQVNSNDQEKQPVEISNMDALSSYSSSDDDDSSYNSINIDKRNKEDNDSDDFYDAIDNTSTSSMTNTDLTKIKSVQNDIANDLKAKSLIDTNDLTSPSSSINRPEISDISNDLQKIKTSHQLKLEDFEALDDDHANEDVDLNSHQSVITHLLTQVRIGMDLTKITLPTFILETRPLLEMYADFFAHTDLFLKIVDLKTPYERMIQVVKWYLSTFHAGRKSPVAKKPYNPILGEIFQCWYDIPDFTSNENTPVTDGPVPWATKDQLTFISEQVSHHPPISAFYAEHYNKRIQLDGYTWTKSKFLGLSIGVHMVGKAVLSLLDYDEEYVFTFPSAFGRSILTVPWFEIGGQVTISCSKSGYSSTIDFLTKPFYGGKKHQIQGSILAPDKKVLHSIEGEWNGTMFIKTGKKQEIFLSTQNELTFKKKIRPLVEQLENESRKLWREVSYYLHTKQIDLATEAKQQIEQRQRDESKIRKERNLKWKTKYFNEQGENWIYVNPLLKRLAQKE